MRTWASLAARLKAAFVTWQIWRHNRRVMMEIAKESAAYFTSFGIKVGDREDAYYCGEMIPEFDVLLNPEHKLPVLDPFGKAAAIARQKREDESNA